MLYMSYCLAESASIEGEGHCFIGASRIDPYRRTLRLSESVFIIPGTWEQST